jgi:hypothetical protein
MQTYPEFPKADSERGVVRIYSVRRHHFGRSVREPTPWEESIDVVVGALHASGCSLSMTAPALLRGWEAMEDRRCEKWIAGA